MKSSSASTSMSSVSVIIPVYQNANTLPRALQSIAAQTLPPAEILICDDGSPDPATQQYLQSLGQQYGGIPLRIFTQANAGAGAARNRCLAHAKGKYIAFLDADDWWLPAKLQRSVDVLEQSGATLVAHDFFAVEPSGKQAHWQCSRIAHQRDVLNCRGNPRLQYFYRGFIGILTVVAHKEALQKAGGFDADHRYALDWECWHAVLAVNPGSFFRVFEEPLACYLLNPQGLTSKGVARLKERESYLARYVKNTAREGGVWWPLLLARAWAAMQVETALPLLKNRQWKNLAQLVGRAPASWCRVLYQSATSRYTRPNFLGRVVVSE